MICEPLELEYVGAVLMPEHEVNLYDMILEKLSLEAILEAEQPDLVAMTGYIAHVGVIKAMSDRVKAVSPQIITVVGGVHAEVIPEDFEASSLDYILSANGLKHIQAIAAGEPTPRIILEEKACTFDYPLPARHLADRYRSAYYYMFHNPCSLIKTSFGCPYSCSFCFCKEITDGKYFARPVDQVLDEIESIAESEIYIVDDDFLFNRKRLLDFCQGLKDREIHKRYLVYGRADFIAENQDVMATLKEVGLRAVIVGLESYSDVELDTYDKKSHISASETALACLSALDIECYGTFIIGADWTKGDFKGLKAFIRRNHLQFVNLQPLTPMPGTALFPQYADQLVIPRTEYYAWDMAHLVIKPTHLSLRQYYFEIVKLYYSITLHPKMILRALLKYPLRENIALSIGANRVMWQYIQRIIKGTP
jgi:radical SAM superfamily enzyme YgiQ (UPF0313 family)